MFTSDGKKVISGSRDKSIIVWDVDSQKPIDQVQIHRNQVDCLLLLPGGKQIISASDDVVKIWNFEIFGLQKDLKGHEDQVNRVSFSYDDKKIVSGSNDRTIIIWNADTGQPIGRPLRGHEK